VISERGAAAQRAEFLKMTALSMLMESRFRPSQECLDLARRAVTASEEANNPAQAGHVNFVLGLIELCHGNFGDAAEQCGRALAMAERTGDLVSQSRCLAYQAVAFRRLGDLARCSTGAKRTLERHETRDGRIHRHGKSKPRVGSVAAAGSRSGGKTCERSARVMARNARSLRFRLDGPLPADCDRIASAEQRRRNRICGGLLAENQHPLPDKLLNPIRKAWDKWQIGAQENATADLASAMKVARQLSYL
jgi:ATP/maltotriose-dependent transcriptional regulator MalT